MKQALAYTGAIMGILIAISLVVVLQRQFSAVTTSVKVITPEPGVHCALASTSDGAALSCWQVAK
jgi:hypothetical protein